MKEEKGGGKNLSNSILISCWCLFLIEGKKKHFQWFSGFRILKRSTEQTEVMEEIKQNFKEVKYEIIREDK